MAEFPPVAELPPPTIQSGTGPQFVSNKWESVSPERVEAQVRGPSFYVMPIYRVLFFVYLIFI